MNSRQTAAATLGGALAAESLIGGIGLAIGGTAIGIPAAAVVATVGGVATAAKLLEENGPKLKSWADNIPKLFWLKKGDIKIRFRVLPVSQKGEWQIVSTCGFKPHYESVETLRKVYKDLLKQGYQPA